MIRRGLHGRWCRCIGDRRAMRRPGCPRPVMATHRLARDTHPDSSHRIAALVRIPSSRSNHMTVFPPITHVALTVRDLSVSVPWYEALLGAKPVLDEDTDPDFHHTVYLVGNGMLIGLHQHATPAPDERFSE